MSLFLLVAILALVVDVGFLLAERRQVQSAADAGALAAATSLLHDDGGMNESGVAYATTNAGVSANDVMVNYPPVSGRFANNPGYVQVMVRKEVPKFFVGMVYPGAWTAAAVAVAGVEQHPVGPYALITLDREREPGIRLNGNTAIALSGDNASVMSNTSIDGTNNSTIQVPGTIDAHGQIVAGDGSLQARGVNEGLPQIDDPLGWMNEPPRGVGRTFPGCRSGCELEPGVYRDQKLVIRGVVTLTPGLYVFDNVEITLQNTRAKLQGSNVLLYFTGNSAFDPKNGEVDVRGPDRALYPEAQPGLVFWFETCGELDMQGNALLRFEGIFYAPCSHVTMHGNPEDDTVRGQIIVGTLDVRGTSDLRLSYLPWVTAERSMVFLVE